MKLYIGTGIEGLGLDGYTTVDINPDNKPDIVADAADLSVIETGSCEIVHASHVLEHFSWPRALLVLNEWARVLKPGGEIKIAVPDMAVYAHHLLSGQDVFNTMNGVYGGHWYQEGGPQGHHFGYTRRMLLQVLTIVGFSEFGSWKSDILEASNTWQYGESQERIVISLNVAGKKKSAPLLDIQSLHDEIRQHRITDSFMVVVRERLLAIGKPVGIEDIDAMLFQKLNYQYMEALHLRDSYKRLAEELSNRPM